MSDALLQIRGVTKVYARGGQPVSALRGVDLEIAEGEYVALTGASGSGKSTLLHILGCLDQPTDGSYRIAGRETASLSRDELASQRRAIGFVFQAFHLLPRLSAIDNVAMPLRYDGVAPADRRTRATEMLARVGLADRAGHRPGELSGGQQQRVAVARALVGTPRVLLCDEPTGNLDTSSGAEVVALLEELRREGRTLVVVTHDAELAARADRIVRVRDGLIESV